MKKFDDYKAKFPTEADELYKMQRRELPDGWDKDIPTFPADAKGMAGRDASGKVLNAIAKNVPWLIGGAADLAPSTKTRLTFEGAGDFGPPVATQQTGGKIDSHGQAHPKELFSYDGRNIHFGIRELAMGAALNGMALSKVRPFGSGFFVFTDFSRPAIRLAAIMEIPVIYVFTHDSIGVGEDGPTHQPIEHLAALRAIPGLIMLRPGDANEVAEAWRVIMKLKHHPVCLVLTRQALPTLDRTKYASATGVAKGAYVLADADGGKPDVHPAGHRQRSVRCASRPTRSSRARAIKARVVSMPSLGTVRRAGRGVPRQRAAAGRDGPRLGRNGRHLRLAPLRRPRRRDHRHEDLRRLGPAEGPDQEVRLQHRGRRRRPPGIRWPSTRPAPPWRRSRWRACRSGASDRLIIPDR